MFVNTFLQKKWQKPFFFLIQKNIGRFSQYLVTVGRKSPIYHHPFGKINV